VGGLAAGSHRSRPAACSGPRQPRLPTCAKHFFAHVGKASAHAKHFFAHVGKASAHAKHFFAHVGKASAHAKHFFAHAEKASAPAIPLPASPAQPSSLNSPAIPMSSRSRRPSRTKRVAIPPPLQLIGSRDGDAARAAVEAAQARRCSIPCGNAPSRSPRRLTPPVFRGRCPLSSPEQEVTFPLCPWAVPVSILASSSAAFKSA